MEIVIDIVPHAIDTVFVKKEGVSEVLTNVFREKLLEYFNIESS